jgi:hypothetical protein
MSHDAWHDELCELVPGNLTRRLMVAESRVYCPVEGCDVYLPTNSGHCHCGSRAYPLCSACKCGNHSEHSVRSEHDRERLCSCDLCGEEAA